MGRPAKWGDQHAEKRVYRRDAILSVNLQRLTTAGCAGAPPGASGDVDARPESGSALFFRRRAALASPQIVPQRRSQPRFTVTAGCALPGPLAFRGRFCPCGGVKGTILRRARALFLDIGHKRGNCAAAARASSTSTDAAPKVANRRKPGKSRPLHRARLIAFALRCSLRGVRLNGRAADTFSEEAFAAVAQG